MPYPVMRWVCGLLPMIHFEIFLGLSLFVRAATPMLSAHTVKASINSICTDGITRLAIKYFIFSSLADPNN